MKDLFIFLVSTVFSGIGVYVIDKYFRKNNEVAINVFGDFVEEKLGDFSSKKDKIIVKLHDCPTNKLKLWLDRNNEGFYEALQHVEEIYKNGGEISDDYREGIKKLSLNICNIQEVLTFREGLIADNPNAEEEIQEAIIRGKQEFWKKIFIRSVIASISIFLIILFVKYLIIPFATNTPSIPQTTLPNTWGGTITLYQYNGPQRLFVAQTSMILYIKEARSEKFSGEVRWPQSSYNK